MPFTLDAVDKFARSLPAVTIGLKWRNKTWMIEDKGFVWERPLSKADIARLGDARVPTGDILGVRTEDLDAKDALLAAELPGFFTIEHFKNYPAVLVALKQARAKDVRAAIEMAYRCVAAALPVKRKPRRSSAG